MAYGIQTFDENSKLLFDSERRTLKLQGWRIVKGFGAQEIKLKQGQRPFFMVVPYNTQIGQSRMMRLNFHTNTNSVVFSAVDNNEFILYYGVY